MSFGEYKKQSAGCSLSRMWNKPLSMTLCYTTDSSTQPPLFCPVGHSCSTLAGDVYVLLDHTGTGAIMCLFPMLTYTPSHWPHHLNPQNLHYPKSTSEQMQCPRLNAAIVCCSSYVWGQDAH